MTDLLFIVVLLLAVITALGLIWLKRADASTPWIALTLAVVGGYLAPLLISELDDRVYTISSWIINPWTWPWPPLLNWHMWLLLISCVVLTIIWKDHLRQDPDRTDLRVIFVRILASALAIFGLLGIMAFQPRSDSGETMTDEQYCKMYFKQLYNAQEAFNKASPIQLATDPNTPAGRDAATETKKYAEQKEAARQSLFNRGCLIPEEDRLSVHFPLNQVTSETLTAEFEAESTGKYVVFRWDWGDINIAEFTNTQTSKMSHTYTTPGLYVVTLHAYDVFGNLEIDTILAVVG